MEGRRNAFMRIRLRHMDENLFGWYDHGRRIIDDRLVKKIILYSITAEGTTRRRGMRVGYENCMVAWIEGTVWELCDSVE